MDRRLLHVVRGAPVPWLLRQSQRLEPSTHLSISIDPNLPRAHIVESAVFSKEKTNCVGAKCILSAELRGDP